MAHNKEHITWLSKNNMPHSHLRGCYREWVDSIILCLDLQAQREKLNAENERIRRLPRALADIIRIFIYSLNLQELARKKELQLFINMNKGHPDPVYNLRFLPPDSILRTPEISQAEWEKAFAALEKSWPSEAITDAARKKKEL